MLKILETIDELAAVERSWQKLSESASPMCAPEWVISAAEIFCSEADSLKAACFQVGGEVKAVAPLCVTRHLGLKKLVWIGYPHLSEPSGFVFENASALSHLVRGVLDLGFPLHLARLPAEAPEAAEMQRLAPRFGLVRSQPEIGAPYLDLGEWDAFEAAMPSRRRGRLRRALRLAEEWGRVHFSTACPREGQWQSAFEKLVEAEQGSWKKAAGSAVGIDPEQRRFYAALAARAAASGKAVFSFMEVGDRIAAATLALNHGGALWILKTSYVEEFSRCSPGLLLMHHLVQYAFEQRLARFEFLGVREPWIEIWTSTAQEYQSINVYPYNPYGLCGLLAGGTRAAARRLKQLTAKRPIDELKAARS